jgi:hypothetical protein
MLALDEPGMTTALGAWLDGRALRAMIARRDRMKTAIDRLVKESSEAAVFAR